MRNIQKTVFGLMLSVLLVLTGCGGDGGGNNAESEKASPVFTSNSSVIVLDNTVNTGYTAQATDADGDSVSYSITGGVDEAVFSIDSETGVLSFISMHSWYAPSDSDQNNIYVVEVTATDGENSVVQEVTVTAVLTPGFISQPSVIMKDNTVTTGYVSTAIFADISAVGYYITGGVDQSMFSIAGQTGALSFIETPVFDIPADSDENNVYVVEVTAADDLYAITQEVAVTVIQSMVNLSSGNYDCMTMATSMGDIVLALDRVNAPEGVSNFTGYADASFYDGTIFHRVIENFMIQGGGFDETLTKKATNAPIVNEADNGLLNIRGNISWARTPDPHSATSQFFINTVDNDFLNYVSVSNWGYAVFGQVINGMDVVDSIKVVETGARGVFTEDVPTTNIVINSVTAVICTDVVQKDPAL